MNQVHIALSKGPKSSSRFKIPSRVECESSGRFKIPYKVQTIK